jgi:hypothetical protein
MTIVLILLSILPILFVAYMFWPKAKPAPKQKLTIADVLKRSEDLRQLALAAQTRRNERRTPATLKVSSPVASTPVSRPRVESDEGPDLLNPLSPLSPLNPVGIYAHQPHHSTVLTDVSAPTPSHHHHHSDLTPSHSHSSHTSTTDYGSSSSHSHTSHLSYDSTPSVSHDHGSFSIDTSGSHHSH